MKENVLDVAADWALGCEKTLRAILSQGAAMDPKIRDIIVHSLVHFGNTQVDRKLQSLMYDVQRPIDELELSYRAYTRLRNGGVRTVSDLLFKTEKELLSIRGFGKKSLSETKSELSRFNFAIGQFKQAS